MFVVSSLTITQSQKQYGYIFYVSSDEVVADNKNSPLLSSEGWTVPGLSLCPHARFSSLLTISVVPTGLAPVISLRWNVLLVLGSPNWTEYSRCSPRSAEDRERITSQSLLLLLTNTTQAASATMARCCSCLIFFVHQNLKNLSLQSVLLGNCSPACTAGRGYSLPDGRLSFEYLRYLLSILRFLSAHFSILARSLWIAAMPSSPFGLIHKIASYGHKKLREQGARISHNT